MTCFQRPAMRASSALELPALVTFAPLRGISTKSRRFSVKRPNSHSTVTSPCSSTSSSRGLRHSQSNWQPFDAGLAQEALYVRALVQKLRVIRRHQRSTVRQADDAPVLAPPRVDDLLDVSHGSLERDERLLRPGHPTDGQTAARYQHVGARGSQSTCLLGGKRHADGED